MVPVEEVVGRAIVIAWPMNRWDTLPVPETFEQDGLQADGPQTRSSAAAALSVAPQGLALAGVVPVVWWRRRRIAAAETH